MLSRDEVEQLLAFQTRAYELLMWLADEATQDPGILSPEVVSALRDPASAAAWLEGHRQRLPVELLPPDRSTAFAHLFCSFFSTSFRVEHLEFEGRLVEARVTVGAEPDSEAGAGLDQCQALALRHLAASERLFIADKAARRLVRRKGLRQASLLWTYLWELDRRARGKGKGSVVHRIWRSIPKETRKAMDAGVVWEAREELLTAVRLDSDAEAP